jgi:Bacterial PH domain
MSTPASKPFRVKLGALWRQVFPVATAAALASAISRWAAGQPFSLPSTLPLAVVAAVIVLGMYWFRPVQVGPEGILLLRRTGQRRLVPWHSITSVSFGRRLPLEPAFRVADSGGQVHWLPRHTANLRELQLLVAHHGGPAHPLARALETPICDAP